MGGIRVGAAGTASGTLVETGIIFLTVWLRPDIVCVWVLWSTIFGRFVFGGGWMGAATRFLAGALAFETKPDAADAGRDAAALFAASGDGASSYIAGGVIVVS